MTLRKALVIADDSPEFGAALRYACRRANATGGLIVLLRVLEPTEFEHWSGVREELERQEREEAERILSEVGEQVIALTGKLPEAVILQADSTKSAIRAAVSADPDIKVIVLASAAAGRGPGPLVESLARDGVNWGARRLPVTVVPGDLTDDEIEGLA
jgi:nucleotide-binding universal stress UspA family protein